MNFLRRGFDYDAIALKAKGSKTIQIVFLILLTLMLAGIFLLKFFNGLSMSLCLLSLALYKTALAINAKRQGQNPPSLYWFYISFYFILIALPFISWIFPRL